MVRDSGGGQEPSASQVPPFLTKTYDMVDDTATDTTVSWGVTGKSFVVWRPNEFASELLPKYFKHNNFSSFVRQLNTYGFRKIHPDQCEFSNEYFMRGRKELLREIHRRKGPAPEQQPSLSLALGMQQFPAAAPVQADKLAVQVASLQQEKDALAVEVAQLRQQHLADIEALRQQQQASDLRQQHLFSLLASVTNNPAFQEELRQLSERTLLPPEPAALDTSGCKRRRVGGDGSMLGPEVLELPDSYYTASTAPLPSHSFADSGLVSQPPHLLQAPMALHNSRLHQLTTHLQHSSQIPMSLPGSAGAGGSVADHQLLSAMQPSVLLGPIPALKEGSLVLPFGDGHHQQQQLHLGRQERMLGADAGLLPGHSQPKTLLSRTAGEVLNS